LIARRSIESLDAKKKRNESPDGSYDSFRNPPRRSLILCFPIGSADQIVTPVATWVSRRTSRSDRAGTRTGLSTGPAVVTTYSVTAGETSTGITLSNGDFLFVSSGGTVVATTVSSGGIAEVLSGGVAKFTSVSSGGYEYILASGSTSFTTVYKGLPHDLVRGAKVWVIPQFFLAPIRCGRLFASRAAARHAFRAEPCRA
jgi:autotransporter passenger strand-loop-strand repeat protein